MNYLPEFLTVATIHLLAVMSPGPDFVMITRNSLKYSRKTAIYSALGLGLGILVHVTYSLVGIGFIISQSVLLFSILKYIGAGYLIYIGIKSLKSKPHSITIEKANKAEDISSLAAIKMGFLTNILNPKATLFFFALFTQIINPSTPLGIQILYGIEMMVATFLWFAAVGSLFSLGFIKNKFASFIHYLEKAMGAILIGLGIKLAFTSSK